MPVDLDGLSNVVALTIKAALAPVLERVAGLEAQLKQALAVESSVTALRERVVAVETKSLLPVVESTDTLTPVLERLAVTDARLGRVEMLEQNVGDVRDRLLTLETKAALPVPIVEAPHDVLTPVLERLAATDARLARLAAVELTVGELHDTLLKMEAKAVSPHDTSDTLTDLRERLRTVEGRLDVNAMGHVKYEALFKQQSELLTRVAVLEVRVPVPGPAGKDGSPGANGSDGKDGADGVTLDDLSLVQENDRTMVVKGTVGARVKDIGTLTFPSEIYRGVYVDGKTYERGDCVTWGGSEWHANETTTSKPGDGSKAWTLKVKRGRDGKDGRDAEAVPVVSLGRPQ